MPCRPRLSPIALAMPHSSKWCFKSCNAGRTGSLFYVSIYPQMDTKKTVRIRLTTTITLTGAGRIPATNPEELRRLPEHLQSPAEAHQDVVSDKPTPDLAVSYARPGVCVHDTAQV